MAVIAIDLGGTKLAAAVFAPNGKILKKHVSLLEGRKGNEVGRLITDTASALQREATGEGLAVDAAGICVPGISHAQGGTVWAPNIPGWEDYPLLDEMRSLFNPDAVRVNIDSDRACSILGEVWQGNAKGCRDAIFLAVGTGIGAGILAGGKILRGAHDIAGAIGWLALDRPFEQKYRSCGCFEYHASGEGIAKVAAEVVGSRVGAAGILATKRGTNITARDVFDAHEKHDPDAGTVLAEAVEFWGMASANLISLFNPEKIIFGGGVFGPATQFLDAIKAEARKWAQPISMAQVTFERSLLGNDAVLYGAAYLALHDLSDNS